jgi:hypothetical protein
MMVALQAPTATSPRATCPWSSLTKRRLVLAGASAVATMRTSLARPDLVPTLRSAERFRSRACSFVVW